MLNAFDRANFDAPIGNLNSANFGVEGRSLAANIHAPSRQMEVALRFSF